MNPDSLDNEHWVCLPCQCTPPHLWHSKCFPCAPLKPTARSSWQGGSNMACTTKYELIMFLFRFARKQRNRFADPAPGRPNLGTDSCPIELPASPSLFWVMVSMRVIAFVPGFDCAPSFWFATGEHTSRRSVFLPVPGFRIQASIWLRPLQKESSSDKFLLTTSKGKQTVFLSKWKQAVPSSTNFVWRPPHALSPRLHPTPRLASHREWDPRS